MVGVCQRAEHRGAVKTAFEAWAAHAAGLTSDDHHPSNIVLLKQLA
jgi:hypothetical protein